MKRAFALGATFFLLSTLSSLNSGAMAQVYPGQEVTVNPGAFGNGYLLYPGGKYGRHVGPLLQPGEKLGVVHLHMPMKHKVVVARHVRKKTEMAAESGGQLVIAPDDPSLVVTSPGTSKPARHAKAAPPPPAATAPDTQFASAPDMNAAPPPAPAKPARHAKAAPAPAPSPDTQFASAPDMNMAPAPKKSAPPPKPVKVAKAAPAPALDAGAPSGNLNDMPEDSAARLIAPDGSTPASPFVSAPPAKKPAAAPSPPHPSAPLAQKPRRVASATPPPANNTPPPAMAAGMKRQSSIPFAPGESSPAVADVAAVHGLAASLNAALNSGAAKVQLDAFGGPRGDKSSDSHRLSLKRALVIRELLIEDGVPAEKIDVRALGGVDDSGPADRVDIYVLA
jgi:outer membrane protein OmpA-like peptidoglycan-associated protein